MRILLWHGFLLSGSGSNLYTANLGRIWRAQGHDVLLLCQERRATEFDFVDAQGDFGSDNREMQLEPTGAERGPGRLRVARPDISGLLPVYVYDDYEGFTVKRFVDLTDEELEHYTSANIRALVTAIEAHQPDAIITGHEIMGPYIAREACKRTSTTFLAKLHGSALEYAVKEQERYRHFAREGLNAAAVVTGGSDYMIHEASSIVGGWDRAAVVNPGCDVDLFRPQRRDPSAPPTVGYVGKFIASKGVHNLLAAAGLTVTPGLKIVIVGYGGFERQLKDLWASLRGGDFQEAERIALEGDREAPLEDVLQAMDEELIDDACLKRAGEITVEWPGRLDHGPLSEVLPTFDVLVVPSVLAEAFGMVAAEAAACGVLPICPQHSGIGEVGLALEIELDSPGLLTYDPNNAVMGLAQRIDGILGLDPQRRALLSEAAVGVARRRWAWERVADRLLELAGSGSP